MTLTSLADRIYSSTKLKAAVDIAEAHGLSPSDTLRDTGIGPDYLSNGENLISVTQYLTALSNIESTRADPYLAFTIGQSVHVSTYGMYGFAILCSKNFRQTMAFAERFHGLATPVARIAFQEDEAQVGWAIEPIGHPVVTPPLRHFLINLQMGIHLSLHRDVMGQEFLPRRLCFDYPRTAFNQVPPLGDVSVAYDQPACFMHIDGHWLDREPPFGNRLTFQQVETLCRKEMDQMARRIGTAGLVRSWLLKSIARPLSLEQIAEEMGLSSRTLRRRLTAENLTYRQILDDVRASLAIRYVKDNTLTNEQTAHALGFSEVSSFRRAFSRTSLCVDADTPSSLTNAKKLHFFAT